MHCEKFRTFTAFSWKVLQGITHLTQSILLKIPFYHILSLFLLGLNRCPTFSLFSLSLFSLKQLNQHQLVSLSFCSFVSLALSLSWGTLGLFKVDQGTTWGNWFLLSAHYPPRTVETRPSSCHSSKATFALRSGCEWKA